MLSAGITREKY